MTKDGAYHEIVSILDVFPGVRDEVLIEEEYDCHYDTDIECAQHSESRGIAEGTHGPG